MISFYNKYGSKTVGYIRILLLLQFQTSSRTIAFSNSISVEKSKGPRRLWRKGTGRLNFVGWMHAGDFKEENVNLFISLRVFSASQTNLKQRVDTATKATMDAAWQDAMVSEHRLCIRERLNL